MLIQESKEKYSTDETSRSKRVDIPANGLLGSATATENIHYLKEMCIGRILISYQLKASTSINYGVIHFDVKKYYRFFHEAFFWPCT